jgi:hypothetical protein
MKGRLLLAFLDLEEHQALSGIMFRKQLHRSRMQAWGNLVSLT